MCMGGGGGDWFVAPKINKAYRLNNLVQSSKYFVGFTKNFSLIYNQNTMVDQKIG